MPLPVAPGDHRDLPPPPSIDEGVESTPTPPPRPNKTARTETLPPPPIKEDVGSGSGVFTQKLPPIPHEQVS